MSLEKSEIRSANLEIYLEFVRLVESLSDDVEDYKKLIHADAEFTEYPNGLSKNGQVRDFAASMEGMKKAKAILAEQRYEIVGYLDGGEKISLEKIWTGKIALDVGNFTKGQELKAYICAVVEFKDGRIYRHRTYDCYEPF